MPLSDASADKDDLFVSSEVPFLSFLCFAELSSVSGPLLQQLIGNLPQSRKMHKQGQDSRQYWYQLVLVLNSSKYEEKEIHPS
jgi:hypothetical protein